MNKRTPNVSPIEKSDPELADLLLQFCNGQLKESKNRSVVKIGRNDPCPCGSGKKYKKCCLKI